MAEWPDLSVLSPTAFDPALLDFTEHNMLTSLHGPGDAPMGADAGRGGSDDVLKYLKTEPEPAAEDGNPRRGKRRAS